MTNILEIRDLSTYIRLRSSAIQAVGNVDLWIEPGETLGLVGESGCGKSMTGLSIMGLLPAGAEIAEGSISLDGQELVGLPEREMRRMRGNDVAMVFQDSMTSLNPTKTIGDQIAEPVRVHRGASKAEALDRAAEVLALVGMSRPRERLGDYPHQLSGGLRQRVMIAIALACEPKLLIADEPTTALDVTVQAQILSLLNDLKRRLGMAVLLITHDMGVVAGHTDRVNIMYAGRMVESAATPDLFAKMRHPYTQALLGSIPRLDSDPGNLLFSIPGLPPDLSKPPAGCRFAARCTRATERCATEEPPLAGPEDHPFACWHPVDGPVTHLSPAPHATRDRPTAAEPLLQVEHVVREFKASSGGRRATVKAVSDVSLTVAPGETFGLVGESGCGKSSLGRLIVGLEKPDSGSVGFAGTAIFSKRGRALRRARRDVQMMFQDPYSSLDPRMRIDSILRQPLVVQNIGNRAEQDARIREIVHDVGLHASALQRFPHELSGGQRQRVGLARALLLEPKIMVADEPVSALDVSVRSHVLNLMKRVQAERGMASVVISHDLAVVKYLADRIGVMYLGKLVEIGTSEQIYARAAHPYTIGLIEAIPEPDPAVEQAKTTTSIQGELPSPIAPPSGCRFRTRCPFAQDICAAEEPQLQETESGHRVACHFPVTAAA